MKNIFLILLLITGFLYTGCIKEGVNAVEGLGLNLVKFSGADADVNTVGFDAQPGVVKRVIVTVVRDANSNASLNTASEVKLKIDTALISAYNKAHGTTFVALSGAFTVEPLNVSFASGEFAKDVSISLDPLKLDLTKSFLLALAIDNSSGDFKIVDSKKTALFNVLAKNKYDGSYEVTGTMVDNASATLTTATPFAYQLHTAGATKVICYAPTGVFIGNWVPILSAGAASAYGSFCPVFDIDASGKIVSVVNSYGQPAGNTRSAEIDPSGLNKVNADRSIDVKFFMKQPSVIAAAPNIRVEFSWHLEYKGSR